MRKFGVEINKSFVNSPEFNHLLDYFLSIEELSTWDWEEIYLGFAEKITQFYGSHQILAYFYRAVKVRSDYITAEKVVGKLNRYFDVLFTRLPGRPAYYILNEAGRKLFEALVDPSRREGVRKQANLLMWVAVEDSRRGVRA